MEPCRRRSASSSSLYDGVQSLDLTGPLEVFTGANELPGRPRPRARPTRSRSPSQGSDAGPHLQRADPGPRHRPGRPLPGAHTLVVLAARAARRPDEELTALAAAARPGRAARHLGLHRGVPAGRGRAAGRPAGHHALGLRRRAAAAVPRRDRRPGADLRPGRPRRHLGRGDRGHRPGPGPGRGGHRPGGGAGRGQAPGGLPAPPGRARRSSARSCGPRSAQRQPLREVQQWITEHPGADLSVDRLAARAGLSPRQFARSFTAETGVSPGRYVGRVRLEAARRGLEDTGDGVEQVARSLRLRDPRGDAARVHPGPRRLPGRLPAAVPAPARLLTQQRNSRADRDPAL